MTDHSRSAKNAWPYIQSYNHTRRTPVEAGTHFHFAFVNPGSDSRGQQFSAWPGFEYGTSYWQSTIVTARLQSSLSISFSLSYRILWT